MERIVQFRDRQELQAADLTNAQTYPRESLDHVVADAVSNGNHFTGFSVAKTSATEISVATGRIYKAGQVFASRAALTQNLFAYLPVTGSKIVTVAAFGQDRDTDIQARDFLTDLTSGATQPSAVAMTSERHAEVTLVAGVESGTPQAPMLSVGLVAMAYVTITPTGITAVVQAAENELPSVQDHEQRMTLMEGWQGQAGPRISSIASDLTALANATNQLAPRQFVIQMAADLALCKTRLNLPTAYASYSVDPFGDATASDPAQVGYACNIQNGLQFPFAASASFNLSFLNPTDSGVTQDPGGLCLPAFTSVPRIQTTGRSGDISISQYQVQTVTVQAVTTTVQEAHQGWSWNWEPSWYSSYYNRYYGSYYNWNLYYGYGAYYNYTQVYTPYTYYTSRTETNYVPVTNTTSITGAMVAETFLVANSMWCSKVGLNFTSVGASGDVNILLVKTNGGRPDLRSALANVIVKASDLKLLDSKGETTVPIPPVFLEGGSRYAIVLISQGTHRLATVDGNNFTQGDLMFSTNGEFLVADLLKDLMFTLYACQFKANRSLIPLTPLQLSGGMTDVHTKFNQIVPDGTDLHLEIQIGGVWYALGDPSAPLNTAPALVPARLVTVSTVDLAPAWKMDNNALSVSRPDVSLMHFSTVRTLAASTTQVTVQALVSNWDAVNHTLVCTLMNGATPVTASSTVSKADPSGQQLITWTFAGLPTISSYRLKLTGTRAAGSKPYVITQRTDCAL